MISAGRVLLMPKGDYDSNTTYEMLDIVSYNGSSYIAKGTTTGNLPTNTTYWQLSAYGGQASSLAGNFAPLETTDYASRAYATDEIFVDKDSQLVVATDAINIGDEIEIGSNCEITSIADLLDAIKDHYDALDQRNRKLIGITQLTAQTDLHSLVPGEYFKKLTNFYVTNGPTGVNQVPTAVFRLTVESGLDESSSSILLTLRASDGKVYTQSYDGTSWSAWVEVASKAYVDGEIASLGTAASKDSTNAITEDSTDLVESGAVYTGLSAKANTADLGTAAYKDSTNAVTSGSTNLVESGAVYDEIQTLSNKVSNSGDAYSPSKAYKVGEYVIHDDVLYKCTTACSAAAWSVNQSCFTLDTLSNAVTSLNTRLTAINKIYQSNLNEAKTIGTGVGCGYIHNLPKGIYLVYTEVGYSKNLSAGARRQVFEGEANLQTNIQILDEFDQYWHSVRSVAILNWQSMRDIYFTAISSDHTDSFSFASVTCIPINI